MHILFDQGTPVPLRPALAGHLVNTVYEMGWSELENGELLKLAEATFDIFITVRREPSQDGTHIRAQIRSELLKLA